MLSCLLLAALLSSDLLALLRVMFSCVFVTFPYYVSDEVGYLIVSVPDLCLLLYFDCFTLIVFLVSCNYSCSVALSSWCLGLVRSV